MSRWTCRDHHRTEDAPLPSPTSATGFDRTPLASWLTRFGALLVGALAGVLALSLVAEALASGALRSATRSMDVEVVVPDANTLPELEERSVVLSPDGVALATLHEAINRREVALEAIPDHVWQALVTAEDRSFFEHEGYDVLGITRAAVANVQARGIQQGGSTITQQLAKSTVGSDRTFDRKIEELLQAMALEERHTKEELLERYVNQVYFGAGAYGVAAAAEEFFALPVDRLRVEQAALLAALVRAPGSNDPRRNPEGARVRRDAVILGMVEEGYLDRDEARMLVSLPLGIVPRREAQSREPYIVEAVKNEFFFSPALNDAFGSDLGERVDLLHTGGLRVHTTIDPNLQDAAERIVREYYPERDGVTAAIAAIDPRSGEVKAAAFGRDFDQEQFNLALQGRRQPGSAFKPFVAATALEQGIPSGISLPGENGMRIGEGVLEPDDPWVVRGVTNYGGSSSGPMDMRQAMMRSVNTAFAQLITMTSVEAVQDTTDRLGVSRAAYNGISNLSIALGGLDRGATPMEMAAAYGTFGTQGRFVQPHVISHIVDQEGREVYRAEATPQQALRPDVAVEITDILTDVVSSGTGTRARLPGWEVAGKTGTTQEARDVWFVGYTPVLSTAVWIGNPDERELLGRATGGGVAAPIWREFMELALAGVEPIPFESTGVDLTEVREGAEVAVPDLRGLPEAEAVRALTALRLVPDLRPVASRQPQGTIVGQSPGAGIARVGDTIRIDSSTGRAPAPRPVAPPPPPPAQEVVAPPEQGFIEVVVPRSQVPEGATVREIDPPPAGGGAPEDQ
jgi:membrane peptidoglycan carboxypeptidase